MEKVSVIIPCYNGAGFIDRSLNSIYLQEYPSIEIIIVDDGSVDQSKEKALKWKQKFAIKNIELKYFYQENQGTGSAINSGLKLVTGDYIILLDVDDEFLPGAINEKVEYLQKHSDINVVRSNGWIIRKDLKYLFVYDETEKSNEDIFLALLRGETNNWAGSYMVRTKALFDFYTDREIYKSRFGQNLQFLLPLAYKNKCGFIDKPQMNYIQQDNSLSNPSDNRDKLEKSLLNAKGYRDIRLYLVDIIVDLEEKELYVKNIHAGYWRSIMNIALVNKDYTLLKEAYIELQKNEVPNINDKINYFSVFSKAKMYFFKVLRKINAIINKVE